MANRRALARQRIGIRIEERQERTLVLSGWQRSRAFVCASALLVLTAQSPVGADAGHPGEAIDDPVVLFEEDFENVPDPSAAMFLDDYTAASGMTYTADPLWIDAEACNGVIGSASIEPPNQICDQQTYDEFVDPVAQALGDTFGGGSGNMVLADVTRADTVGDGNSPFLETVGLIPLSGPNRFIGFLIDAAVTSCDLSAHPLYDFFLVDGAEELNVNNETIDPCTDPRGEDFDLGKVGSYATDAALLFEGTEVGIRLYNREPDGTGNDSAVDNIRLVDATPQLDKEFVPTEEQAGEPVVLRFTVTNTSELGAKQGWSFTDDLPDGLEVADPAGFSSDCDLDSAPGEPQPGDTSIAVHGNLATGQAACTIEVSVVTPADAAPGTTFVNGPDHVVELTGLNPPADTTLTVDESPEPVPALPPLAFVLLVTLLATATLWILRRAHA